MTRRMSYPRRGGTVTDPHRETVIVEETRADHAEAATAERESVTTHADGWTMAQGGMRMFNSLIALVMLVIEALLGFRLAFALGGANPNNGFVDFIYDVTKPLVAPFEGIFARSVDGDTVFEPETVIAMAVWLLVALLLVAVVNIFMSAPAPARTQAVERERHAHYDSGIH